jgi:hypothetical protein
MTFGSFTKPGNSSDLQGSVSYRVTFRAGRYKYVSAREMGMGPKLLVPGAQECWIIGRELDGATIGFCFEEEEAKHIVLSLNLLDAFMTGDTAAQREFLALFERMKKQ